MHIQDDLENFVLFFYCESDHLVEEKECEQDLEGSRGEDADVRHHLQSCDDAQQPHLHHDHQHPQHHNHHG